MLTKALRPISVMIALAAVALFASATPSSASKCSSGDGSAVCICSGGCMAGGDWCECTPLK